MQIDESNPPDDTAGIPADENATGDNDARVSGSAALSQKEQKRIFREVCAIMQRVWPELCEYACGTPDDKKRKKKLVTALDRKFSSVEANYARFLLALHIQKGNLQGAWKITIPWFRVRWRRPRSPMTPWTVQGSQFLEYLEEGFWRSMRGGNAVDGREFALQLLAAAILYGGVLSWQHIHALCDCTAERLSFGSGRLSLDVPLAPEPETGNDDVPADPPVWRWDAHWMPGILLCRWKLRGGQPLYAMLGYPRNPDRNVVWATLRGFFVRHGVVAHHLPPSLNALMEWSATRFLQESGLGVLAGYARGRNDVTSLQPGAWGRFLTGGGRAMAKAVQSAASGTMGSWRTGGKGQPPVADPSGRERLAEVTRTVLRIAQGKERRETLKSEIVRLRGKYAVASASALDVLLRWSERLMGKGSGRKGSLSARSVYSYLNVLGKRLLRQPVTDFTSASEEEIIVWYEGMLDDCGTDKRRAYLSRQIVDFHDCARIECGAPDVDFAEIEGFMHHASGVDANLVTVPEYERILELLEPTGVKESSRLAWVCAIALMLGFRTGLRLGEIRRLRIADIVFPGNEILYVRRNVYGDLKSANAQRPIPLRVLLADRELGHLRRWIETRMRETGGNLGAPLLAIEPYASTILPPAALTDLIHEAMRLVTGDPSIRFHMLRHSFANWTFIKLVAGNIPGMCTAQIGAFDHPEFSEEAVCRLRQQLMELPPKDLPSDEPIKAALYRLSLLLGHSGPDMTLRHYIHLCDYLLGCALRNRPLNFRPELLSQLMGVGESRIYALRGRARRLKRSVGEVLLDTAARKSKVRIIAAGRKVVPPAARKVLDARLGHVCQYEFADIFAVASILPALNELDTDAEARGVLASLAKKHAVDLDLLQSWFDVAMGVRSRYITREQQARHWRFPAVPHGHEDRAEFYSILVNLRRGLNDLENAELVRWGMEQFLSRAVINRREVVFQEVAHARRYVKFLAYLGISRERLHLAHLPRRGSDPTTADQDRRWWARRLAVAEGNVRRRDREANRIGFRHGAVALSVQSLWLPSGHSDKENSSDEVARQAAMTFGNAIHMLVIQDAYRQHMATCAVSGAERQKTDLA